MEEDTILIAEFVDDEFFEKLGFTYPKPMFQKGRILPEHCKFHTSWDWLMPVVEKCKESQVFGSQRLIDNIEKRLIKIDLLAVHSNVVEFIKWYNKNK